MHVRTSQAPVLSYAIVEPEMEADGTDDAMVTEQRVFCKIFSMADHSNSKCLSGKKLVGVIESMRLLFLGY